MNKSYTLNINPQMLKWAKTTYGLSDTEMAKKLGVDIDRYESFEKGIVGPTITQLRKLAKQIKTPVAVFYLKNKPDGIKFPKDYRNHDGRSTLSIKSRLAIRRATSIQDFLESIPEWRVSPDIKHFSSESSYGLAQELRQRINYTPERNISRERLYDSLRKYLESISIITLELPLPTKELRGFSIHGKPTIISTAVGDPISGKIFTLLHEFAHILIQKEGMCDPYKKVIPKQSVEYFCNQFAADFLITDSEFDNHISMHLYDNGLDDTLIKKMSDRFKTSREVIMIKMIHKNMLDWDTYFQKRKEWQLRYEKEKKFFAQPNPVNRAIRENGRSYTNEVYNQLHSNLIQQGEAAERLAVNINYIDLVGERLNSD